MQHTWEQWAELLASKTGKCPGRIPSFGLPTDSCTEQEFRQAVSQIPLHDAKTCSCWVKEDPVDLASIMEQVRQVRDRGMSQSLTTSDSVELMCAITEKSVRGKVAVLKKHVKALVDRISVDNFRMEGSHVKWDVEIPDNLLQVVSAIKGLAPRDFNAEEESLKKAGVLKDYEPPPK